MTIRERHLIAVGEMLLDTVAHVHEVPKEDQAYAIRGASFRGKRVTVIVIRDDEAVKVVEKALAEAFNITSVTLHGKGEPDAGKGN